MIKTSYDPEADAMFIWLAPESVKSEHTTEVAPGIMLDYDAEVWLVGIEILDLRARMATRKERSVAAE